MKMISSILIALAAVFYSGAAFAAGAAGEEIVLQGLRASVTVKYDEYGVPSIYGESVHDVTFAEGYVHARDRLWQMDLNRREASGRMAEWFGKDSVGGDFQKYLATLPQLAVKMWEECAPVECEIFQAYADGVNAYIGGMKELPEEYRKLGVTPEKWSPVDSFAIGRMMSWGMSSDLGLEIALGVISKTIGKAALMKILPIDGVDPITILGEGGESSFPADDFDVRIAGELDGPLYTMGISHLDTFRGSNNWVVSGARTGSGNPILSSDTHMGFPLPCTWYELHLKAGDLHVAGLSLPGAPGLLIGHNERVAWGVTQARYDVMDAYVEKLDPKRPDTHYLHKGESLPFEVEKVRINYKTDTGMEVEERTLLRTIHGPVVYEADRPRAVTSYRWTGHKLTHEPLAFIGYMTAKNLDEFKAALDHFEVGALNFVYADVDGNIYYRTQGTVPIRKGDAFLPLDGSSGKYEWTGYIPFTELPQLENPSRGYAASANNRQAGKDYPYYLGALYDKGYRARRITDMILGESGKSMTAERMREMQNDVYSLAGERLLPLLYTAVDSGETPLTDSGRKALGILKAWDLLETTDAAAPSVFYMWLQRCVINIFKDNLPENIFNNMGRTEVLFPLLLKNEKLPMDLYDDLKTPDVHETKNIILARSLNDAADELEKRFGADPAGWIWGNLHKVTPHHRLGGEFNIPPEPADGGTDTVNVAGFGLLGGDFNFGAGPNMRFTVEMEEGKILGRNVIVGGQSGDRNSPRYSDQFRMWLNKETRPMLFYDADVDAHATEIIIMKPE